MSWQDDPLRMAALVYIIKRRKNYDFSKFADTDTGLLQMCASKKLQKLWQVVKNIPKKELLDRLTVIDDFYKQYYIEWPTICDRFYSRSINVKRSSTWIAILVEPSMEYNDVFEKAMGYKTIPILKSLEQRFDNPDVQRQYNNLKRSCTPKLLRASFMKNFVDSRPNIFGLADYVMMGIFLKCVDYSIAKFFSQNGQNYQPKPFEPPSESAPLNYSRNKAHNLTNSILRTFTTPLPTPASVLSTEKENPLPASEVKQTDSASLVQKEKSEADLRTTQENKTSDTGLKTQHMDASENPPDSGQTGQTEKRLPTPAQPTQTVESKKGFLQRTTDYFLSFTPWSTSHSVPISQLVNIQKIIDESHAKDPEKEKVSEPEAGEAGIDKSLEDEAKEDRTTLKGLRQRFESSNSTISELTKAIQDSDALIRELVSAVQAEAAKEADPDDDVSLLKTLRKQTEQAQQVKENLEKQLLRAQSDAQKIEAQLKGRLERRTFSSTHIHTDALSGSESDSGETESVGSNESGKTDSVSSELAVDDRPSDLLHVPLPPRREKRDSPRFVPDDKDSDTGSVDPEDMMQDRDIGYWDPDNEYVAEDLLISPELRSREGHQDEAAEPDDAVSAELRRDHQNKEEDEEDDEQADGPPVAPAIDSVDAAPDDARDNDDAKGAALASSGGRLRRLRREVDPDNIVDGWLRPIPGRRTLWRPASHMEPRPVSHMEPHALFEASPDYISGHVEYPSDMGISEILFDVGDCESQVYPSLETQTHQPHGFWSQSDILELCVGDSHSPELLGAGFQCNDVGEVSVQVVNGMSGPVYEVNCVSDLASCMKDPQSNVGLQSLELLGGNLPPQEPVKVDGLVLFDISPIQSGLKLGSPTVNTSALSCTQADKHDFSQKDLYSGQLQTKAYHCIRDGVYDLRKVDKGEMQFRFDM